MCGIFGSWAPFKQNLVELRNMADKIHRRGPDAFNDWSDLDQSLYLAHHRLAIQDLSSNGGQPMASMCGRYMIVFNGEIYNHLELRETLAVRGFEPPWTGTSDTETLINCISYLGLEQTLKSLNGMFAFAVWDKIDKSLLLARDRSGEKPLYFGDIEGRFFFSSDLAPFTAQSDLNLELDTEALTGYFWNNCISGMATVFKNFKKLPPASYIHIQNNGKYKSQPKYYWQLPSQQEKISSKHKPSQVCREKITKNVLKLLTKSVERRMISDVPVGAFLSGGVDSALVVSVMQELSSSPVQTFSLGSDTTEYNEAPQAKKIANFLGTDHHEIYISDQDVLKIIPQLPEIYSEPFADSSQLPSVLISQIAKNSVSVVLTGDGGDELFAGYNRHIYGPILWGLIKHIPRSLRRSSACVGDYINKNCINYISPRNSKLIRKSLNTFSSENLSEFYHSMRCHLPPEALLNPKLKLNGFYEFDSCLESLLHADFQNYLVDDVLTKVDRATMFFGLEARVPFLDHELIEYAWGIPPEFKVGKFKGKLILRELLHRKIPDYLIQGKKQGFAVPLGRWMRGPLIDWCETLLSSKNIQNEGIFCPHTVKKLWNDHKEGVSDNSQQLWCVLMFRAWTEHNSRFSAK